MSEGSPSSTGPQSTADVTNEIVQTGGSSPVSWDELESVSKFQKEVKKKEVKQEKEIEKEISTKKDKKNEKENQQEKGSKKDHQESNEEESSEQEEGDQESKSTKPSTNNSNVKKIKAKGADGDIELASDLKVPVKINGKLTEVTIQEALSRYSQQSHLDSLYKDFQKEKTSWESEREAIGSALDKSYDYLVNKKDLRGFLDYMGEALGVDSHKLYEESLGSIQAELEQWQGMSPEERRMKELEKEAEYYRSKETSRKQEQEQAKSRQALESQLNKVMQQNGMSPKELVEAYDSLKKAGVKEQDISPDQLASFHKNTKTIEAIESKLKELKADQELDYKEVEAWATEAIQGGYSQQEILQAIASTYEVETPEKKLNKKINRSQKKAFAQGPRDPNNSPMFFGDL